MAMTDQVLQSLALPTFSTAIDENFGVQHLWNCIFRQLRSN